QYDLVDCRFIQPRTHAEQRRPGPCSGEILTVASLAMIIIGDFAVGNRLLRSKPCHETRGNGRWFRFKFIERRILLREDVDKSLTRVGSRIAPVGAADGPGHGHGLFRRWWCE